MPATVLSAATVGVDACLVHVEVDTDRKLPAFTLVGLPDSAVRESREYSDQTSLTGQHFRTVFVHTRAIRDRIMQRKEVRVGGEVVHATINTTLEDDEVAQFESDWAMLWKPAITQQQLTNIESKAVDFRTEDDAIVPGSSCNNKSLQLEGGDKKAITHNP